MTPFVESEIQKANFSPLLYDLYAVSNHFGSLACGHYTAFCKNAISGKWYDFNDSSVSEVYNLSDIVTGSAYVLYYRRKDFYPDNNIDYTLLKHVLDDEGIIDDTTDANKQGPSS